MLLVYVKLHWRVKRASSLPDRGAQSCDSRVELRFDNSIKVSVS